MEHMILYFSLGDFYVDIQTKKEDMGFIQHMLKKYFESNYETVPSIPQTHVDKFELATGTAHDSYNIICYGTSSEFDKNIEFVNFFDTM
jgi:adenine deaminase